MYHVEEERLVDRLLDEPFHAFIYTHHLLCSVRSHREHRCKVNHTLPHQLLQLQVRLVPIHHLSSQANLLGQVHQSPASHWHLNVHEEDSVGGSVK